MKIQFDHQTFSLQQYGGISRYFAVLQQFLQTQDDVEIDRGVLVSRNHYLPADVLPMSPTWGKRLVSRSRTYAFNQRYCRSIIAKNQFDLFHPSYYDAYFIPRLKKPFVLTVHDLTHELFPEFFPQEDPFITYKRQVIERADHIIAISASTKNDLREVFGVEEQRITVIHHGLYPIAETGESVDGLPQRYILYVGARNGYKNFVRFVKACALVLQQEKDLKVLCAGGGTFNLAERELLLRLKLSNSVRKIEVSDGQLKTLYENAQLFVYPSLYEGFGLPLLEAFHNNCPVAVSKSSCFPEVGGQAVCYFEPYAEEDIARAISSVVADQALQEKLRLQGQQRLKHFALEDCMKKTLGLYKAMIKN